MVLITGASGFLGKHLVRYISGQGVRARALYYNHPPGGELKELPGIEWMSCDLLDIYAVAEAMAGITDIYHCAAIVTFDPGKREEMLHFNPESTTNIVNQALEQGIRKMVYVSSVAAIGRSGVAEKQITEEEEWGESRYNSAYGISKYMAEMEVWRGIGEGLNAVIINPGIILGAGDGHDLSHGLMKMVYKEFPFYSKGVTAWVDVADVVHVLTRLMSSEIEGERFIVSSGNMSYRDIFINMAASLHKKPPCYPATTLMTGIAWRLSMLKSTIFGGASLITKEMASNANAVCIYDNSKLLRAFPEFNYMPVNATIEAMARSFTVLNKK